MYLCMNNDTILPNEMFDANCRTLCTVIIEQMFYLVPSYFMFFKDFEFQKRSKNLELSNKNICAIFKKMCQFSCSSYVSVCMHHAHFVRMQIIVCTFARCTFTLTRDYLCAWINRSPRVD